MSVPGITDDAGAPDAIAVPSPPGQGGAAGVTGSAGGGQSSGGQSSGGQSSGGQTSLDAGSGAGGYTIHPDGTCSLPVGSVAPGCPLVLQPPCTWALGGTMNGTFSCELPFNAGPSLDPTYLDYIDVYFGSGFLEGGRLLRVAGAAACGTTGNGWYFDSPQSPTKIVICPNACDCATGQAGTFNIVEGCWANAAPGVLDAAIPCPHCANSRQQKCLQGFPSIGHGIGLGKCELPLPNGFDAAYTNVKYVQHGHVAGPAEPWDGYLTFVPSLSHCDKVEEGWTLDASSAPPTVRICPSACSCVKVNHAALMVEAGCKRLELGGG